MYTQLALRSCSRSRAIYHFRISSSLCNLRKFSSINYCVDLVKQQDFDNYLVGLIIPIEFRNLFFAFRAFNVEIASIKESTQKNDLAGRIRIQWWRDAIDSIYFKSSNLTSKLTQHESHPVVQSLSENVQKYKLSQIWFERCLDARLLDLRRNQSSIFLNLSELETYAENSYSSLNYLFLEVINLF